MRCQTPSRYVSHAIVRLIGSALAASAPSTCGTMVEKRPLPISEEKRRETSLSRFFIQNPFFSKKADQKRKNMVIALHVYFSYLSRDLYNVLQIIVIYHFQTCHFLLFLSHSPLSSALDLSVFARSLPQLIRSREK